MRNVYVLGTGMLKFGRYPEKSVPELGGEAAELALKDAGISIKDIEFFACGNLYQANAMVGQRILQQIGQTGIPVINVSNACATGSTAFRESYMSVASGMYDIAMAVGVEQMGKQGLLGGGGGAGTDPAYGTEGKLGSGLMPAVFGQAGVEHMRKYGTTREHFAKISVKSHKHATKNPYSQYRNEVTLEDVMNARMVAFPNTLYMCCPTGDGAAAAILVSEDKLKQLAAGRKRPRVAASVLTSDPWTDRDLTLPDVSTLTRRAVEEGLRDRRDRAERYRANRAARLLRDCGAGALREPRTVRRRRGRQVYRRRRRRASGARRQCPGQRLGRPALEGASAGRHRRREYLRGRVASDPGRSCEGSPRAQREGRTGARDRARLCVHDPYTHGLRRAGGIKLNHKGRREAALFLYGTHLWKTN